MSRLTLSSSATLRGDSDPELESGESGESGESDESDESDESGESDMLFCVNIGCKVGLPSH